ncbi:glycosyltransferase family 2 protein [Mucisphaera calidilacus]|uniref:Glycosyl transferase family 2 n=1 Tax=Mucisphaera calidilacus TaxID=2527982 RepID=A0A518BUX7_9BACT|nr:glycosyltransferase [Mucisphaera calidilacus]QDU70790.1 Glycosyl transferase family 2 [Mucisphaera calidilacus]
MKVSYVIVTHNRRSALGRTLKRLRALVRPGEAQDIWVIDNASDDGTGGMLAEAYPDVHLIERADNAGACARTDAVGRAEGDLLVFLDDDSYPMAGVIEMALERFSTRPSLGLLGGAIELPDGSAEASAYPLIPVGCGMIGRHEALREIGGFDRWFSRQAEEFDLAMRMLGAGWGVERDGSMVFRHDKPAGQRRSAEVCRLDLRNNLVVAGRYLPHDLGQAFREDWIQRYALIAEGLDLEICVDAIVAEADERLAADGEQMIRPLSAAAIDRVFEIESQARRVAEWSRRFEPCRVVIADYGKNVFTTYDACRRSGLEVLAVADTNPAFAGHFYRGVPILTDAEALDLKPEGVVVANINPAQVGGRWLGIKAMTDLPLLCFNADDDDHDVVRPWSLKRGAA